MRLLPLRELELVQQSVVAGLQSNAFSVSYEVCMISVHEK